jgi:hypothetical protein
MKPGMLNLQVVVPGAAGGRPRRDWGRAADDEAGGLDGGEDLGLGEAVLEGAGCGCGGGGGATLVADVADPGGVAGLDGQDAAGADEDGLGLDVRDLAEIGVDAGVLEHVGGGLELGLVLGRALEVELRLRHGGGAERLSQEGDVGGLVLGDDGREAESVLVCERLRCDSLGVEGGLEVLQGEREIEDGDVGRRHRGAGERRQGTREGGAADHRTRPEAGLLQERAARVPPCVLGGLFERTVAVERLQERHRVDHVYFPPRFEAAYWASAAGVSPRSPDPANRMAGTVADRAPGTVRA